MESTSASNPSQAAQLGPHIDFDVGSQLKGPSRPTTLEDILSVREILEPRQSPDGRYVAFIVKQAFRSCNCYRAALYVIATTPNATATKILEEQNISNIRWANGGESISYLSDIGGTIQIWLVEMKSGVRKELFSHAAIESSVFNSISSSRKPVGVFRYEWSPDGTMLVFTAQSQDLGARVDAAKLGYRYDDSRMQYATILEGSWGTSPRTQLWLYKMREQKETLIWETSPGSSTSILDVSWRPDGKAIAIIESEWIGKSAGGRNQSVRIIDLSGWEIHLAADGPGWKGSPIWTEGGKSLAFYSSENVRYPWSIIRLGLDGGIREELSSDLAPSGRFLAFLDNNTFLFESDGLAKRQEQTGLYIQRKGSEPRRLTPLGQEISDCDRIVGKSIACIWQSPTMAPRPALVNSETGVVVSLVNVNPESDSLALSDVEELHWTNKYGDLTSGFLALPTQNKSPGRVPLLVIAYSFSGDFVAQASRWKTSYPVQAFARDGIAVLLLNMPRYEDWDGADFGRASVSLACSPLSSLEVIVDELSQRGVIDRDRVGFAGQSFGGFAVEFAIAHTKLIRAAEILNGGTLTEPGVYWLVGNELQREFQIHYMGGPPYGGTLNNYLDYSFNYNADKVDAPVLMEFSSLEALAGMEAYTALRTYEAPVEFYIYPGDGHNFFLPEHRIQSMQRNLDWFEFWLLGKARDEPDVSTQYARWREMKNNRVDKVRSKNDSSDRSCNR